MIDLVQNTIDGVMIGSSYGLLALGFTLIFGVMRRLNLSYGPSIMIGGYLGTVLYLNTGAGPLAVAGAVVLGAVIAGIYVERLCFAPMKAGAGIASMVSSFAIWMQLEQAAILVLPRHTYPFPPLATGAPLEFGPFLVRIDHLVMLVCALALAAAVQLALYRTRFGLAVRAIIGNPVAAHLVGIDVRTRRAAGLRRRLGDRRRRRLPGARGRPAGHADVRHVGDIEGPDRHDDRRARIGPRRGGRRIAARRRGGATANGISGRRSAISSPISCCSRFLVVRPGGLLGRAPDSAMPQKA